MLKRINLEDFRAQLELDREWREAELRSLGNARRIAIRESHREALRKAYVTLLYAHYEGFVVGSLDLYVASVNELALSREMLSSALLATSLSDAFSQCFNPKKKSRIFSGTLPDDSALHRFAREQELVGNLDSFLKITGAFQIDNKGGAQSNLNPAVLKKLLFRLGLNFTFVDLHSDAINKLLGHRNAVAHGSVKRTIEDKECVKLGESIGGVLDEYIRFLTKSIANDSYLSEAASTSSVHSVMGVV